MYLRTSFQILLKPSNKIINRWCITEEIRLEMNLIYHSVVLIHLMISKRSKIRWWIRTPFSWPLINRTLMNHGNNQLMSRVKVKEI